MKMAKIVLFFALVFCAQPSVMFLLSFKGAAPNLLLCVTLLLVLTEKDKGAVIGIAVLTAALQELCFSAYPGPASAAIFLVGASAAFAERVFTSDSLAFIAGVTIVETILSGLAIWAGGKILGAPYRFLYVLGLQPLYIFCNLVLMLLFYILFIKKHEGGYRV